MKKIVILVMVSVFLIVILFADENTMPKNEVIAMEKLVLDYIEGWYNGDVTSMERALHPEYFTKRGIFFDPNENKTVVRLLDAKTMIEYTKRGGGKSFPREKLKKNKIIILDMYKNIATVRAVSTQYIDYLHLAKFKEDWKIINVIWRMREDQ